MQKQKVLIVGGGFAGVKAALELANNNYYDVEIISDAPDLRYYPTLFHSATGAPRRNSSIPLAFIFKNTNVGIHLGAAVSIDRQSKQIITSDKKSYSYDYLILALGVVTNYFNIPGLEKLSFSIKSQDEALRFKKHLHSQLIDERKPDLNYVVVGGGPTGIELAGALPSYLDRIMRIHGLPARKIHVDLVEANARLLPNLPLTVSRDVQKRLEKLGVTVMTNRKVEGLNADGLTVNGKPIASHTVVWTAGVTNNPFFANNHFVLMGRGKVAVDVYLQSEPNIFVLGDNANTPYSGLAQTALVDAEFVANNLLRRASNKDYKSYVAKKPITVIPAGPNWAAVVWGNTRMRGLLGHVMREGGDIVGFHDIESWKATADQYLSEYLYEDDCNICARVLGQQPAAA
jgi:NADH dehydrogenase